MTRKHFAVGIILIMMILCLVVGNESAAFNGDSVVTTVAGRKVSAGAQDGIGTAAGFGFSAGIATDGSWLYIADTFNHTIRKVEINSSTVYTVAGQKGVSGYADGEGPAARFNSPHGIATDGSSLYVADTYNNTIRKVSIATGAVSTLAGEAGVAGTADGVGANARFSGPYGITINGFYLYVTDIKNSTIRKIDIATGAVTTLAGMAGETGAFDGYASAARFNYPAGITSGGENLFVVDSRNHVIRKIVASTAEVSTLAGTAGVSGSADGQGAAALFKDPDGITFDNGNLYVADKGNKTIRQIVVAGGDVSTVAGSAGEAGGDDGSASTARFYNLTGIVAVNAEPALFLVDSAAIRKVQ